MNKMDKEVYPVEWIYSYQKGPNSVNIQLDVPKNNSKENDITYVFIRIPTFKEKRC